VSKPCAQCPWRLSNQGTRSPGAFYTKANLRRLWRQVRGGGKPQSCHLTDPSHPDHVAAGARPGATAKECPGSVVLVLREIHKVKDERGVVGGGDSIKRYLATRRRGLTKTGLLYWIVQRILFANVPLMNSDGPLPDVDVDDPEIGLPKDMQP
jgi:hypothetical protein